jgi:hypothetical protein
MVLNFPDYDLEWPEVFEEHLKSKSMRSVPKPKAQHRLDEVHSKDLNPIGFQGRGHDAFE